MKDVEVVVRCIPTKKEVVAWQPFPEPYKEE